MVIERRQFQFDVDPSELFLERTGQFVASGIQVETVRRVQRATRDMWTEGPGGWAYEWEREAQKAERGLRWLEASLLYGAAKFPTLSTPIQRHCFEKQLECYLKASPSFPCVFERRILPVAYRGAEVPVAVHGYAPFSGKDLPLVCLSAGVDTLKMELHRVACLLARVGGFRVAVMDMPGTGESVVPLQGDSYVFYASVIEQLRGSGKAALWGMSFGGHWAAKLACLGLVDAAVNLGGFVGVAPLDPRALPNGMPGILANAFGDPDLLSAPDAAVMELYERFSLKNQGLLPERMPTPLLVVNGSKDPYVPASESQVFQGRNNAQTWITHGGNHCAANQMPRVIPAILGWLRLHLHGSSMTNRVVASTARACLPALVA